MRRKLVLVLVAVCMIAGCGKTMGKQDNVGNSQVTEKVEEKDTSIDEKVESTSTDINCLKEILGKFDRVYNVEYVSNDKLLVVADKMYLLDISTGKVLGSTTDIDYVKGQIKLYSDDANIIIIGKESMEIGESGIALHDDDCKECIMYYDHQLNLVKSININDEYGINPSASEVAVSKDGKLAIYDYEYRKLYLCDSKNSDKKVIWGDKQTDIIFEDKIQFYLAGEIEFTEDGEKIIFNANCMDYPVRDDSDEYWGVGSVSLDGSEITVHKAGDEYSKMESYSEYAILSQDCGFTNPTGKAVKYIYNSDTTETIELKTSKESENIFCSENGKILTSSEENDKKGYIIRFYDAKTGEFIKEGSVDEMAPEKYSAPQIFTFGDYDLAIAFFRANVEEGKDLFQIMKL